MAYKKKLNSFICLVEFGKSGNQEGCSMRLTLLRCRSSFPYDKFYSCTVQANKRSVDFGLVLARYIFIISV